MRNYKSRRGYEGQLDPLKLKQVRQQANLSQEQLGERMDPPMDRTKITRYEAGETKRPTSATMNELCRVLGCEIGDLTT